MPVCSRDAVLRTVVLPPLPSAPRHTNWPLGPPEPGGFLCRKDPRPLLTPRPRLLLAWLKDCFHLDEPLSCTSTQQNRDMS